MTLRDYFTKHPRFRSDGKLEVVNGDVLTFCGVPFNAALWKQLKDDRLDDEVPAEVLEALNEG